MSELESLDSQLIREWPNVEIQQFREALNENITKRRLQYLEDVTVDSPRTGQCLLYNGHRWIAGSVTSDGKVSITDHGALTGLLNDTHPQYLNMERASEHFYSQQQVQELLSEKASNEDVGYIQDQIKQVNKKPTATLSDLGGAPLDHDHDNLYYRKDYIDDLLTSKADNNKVFSHSSLTGLDIDDHKQYLNEVRGDIRYYTKPQIDQSLASKSDVQWVSTLENRLSDLENEPAVTLESLGGVSLDHTTEEFATVNDEIFQISQRVVSLENDPDIGITVHSELTGLESDDHPQYLTNSRADNRYYTKSEMDASLSGKVSLTSFDSLTSRVQDVESRPVFDSTVYLTKTEVNTALGLKANNIDVNNLAVRLTTVESRASFDSTLYYNKTNIDNLLNNKVNTIDINNINTNISTLASRASALEARTVFDSTQYYTKTNINTLLDDKINTKDFNVLGTKVTNLENRPTFDSSIYYTKTDTNSLLANKANSSDISSLTTKVTTLESRPVFDNTLYYTKTNVNTLLDAKYNVTDANTLANRVTTVENRPVFDGSVYYNKTDINSLLGAKVNTTDFNSSLTRITTLESRPVFDSTLFYSKTDVNSLLNNKTNVSDTSALTSRVSTLEARPLFDSSLYYNKTNVNDLLAAKASSSDLLSLTSRVSLVDGYDYPLSEYGIHCTSVPLQTALSGVSMTSGKMFLTRVYVPANVVINKILFYVRTVGALPGTATSGVAVYSDSGTLLGSVLSNALFTTLGWRTATLSSTIASQSTARFVWIGMVSNFSTIPAVSGLTVTPTNGGVVSTHRRNLSITATTTFPATFAPATYATNDEALPLMALGA